MGRLIDRWRKWILPCSAYRTVGVISRQRLWTNSKPGWYRAEGKLLLSVLLSVVAWIDLELYPGHCSIMAANLKKNGNVDTTFDSLLRFNLPIYDTKPRVFRHPKKLKIVPVLWSWSRATVTTSSTNRDLFPSRRLENLLLAGFFRRLKPKNVDTPTQKADFVCKIVSVTHTAKWLASLLMVSWCLLISKPTG